MYPCRYGSKVCVFTSGRFIISKHPPSGKEIKYVRNPVLELWYISFGVPLKYLQKKVLAFSKSRTYKAIWSTLMVQNYAFSARYTIQRDTSTGQPHQNIIYISQRDGKTSCREVGEHISARWATLYITTSQLAALAGMRLYR